MPSKYLPWDDFRATYPYSGIIKVGEGAYGAVYRSKDYVVKRMFNKSRIVSSRLWSAFLPEVNIYTLVQHPCVCQLLNWTIDPSTYEAYMLMPAGENIVDAVRDKKITIEQVAKDLIAAMHFLNTHRIVHADLKPANVIFLNGRATIIDFGISKWAHLVRDTGLMFYGTAYTPYARDPQYLDNDVNSIKCELYSIAVTLYLIYALSFVPTQSERSTTIDMFIKQGMLYTDLHTGNATLDAIIDQCVVFPVTSRPTIGDIYASIGSPYAGEGTIEPPPPMVPTPPDHCTDNFITMMRSVISLCAVMKLSARTCFTALDLFHRTVHDVPGIFPIERELMVPFMTCIMLLAIIVTNDWAYELFQIAEEFIKIFQMTIDVTRLDYMSMMLRLVDLLSDRLYYPTYWDAAISGNDLPVLLQDTLRCTYNPQFIRQSMSFAGRGMAPQPIPEDDKMILTGELRKRSNLEWKTMKERRQTPIEEPVTVEWSSQAAMIHSKPFEKQLEIVTAHIQEILSQSTINVKLYDGSLAVLMHYADATKEWASQNPILANTLAQKWFNSLPYGAATFRTFTQRTYLLYDDIWLAKPVNLITATDNDIQAVITQGPEYHEYFSSPD